MIATDKLIHFLGGACIALGLGYFLPAWAAFAAAAVVGAGKEWWDYHHPTTNTADGWDFVATGVGGLVGAVVILVAIRF